MIIIAKKGENIYKRKDGRWEGRYVKGRNAKNRIVYGYVYGRRYSDVKDKLIVMKAKHIRTSFKFRIYEGAYEEWLGTWLRYTVKNAVKSTTYSCYKQLVKRYIFPSLGPLKLHEIQPEQIRGFIRSLQENNLSASTIRLIFSLVKRSFDEAERSEYLTKNPCRTIILPKQELPRVRALSVREQKELERLALTDPECSPVLLALYSGMRIGEISGLRWEDIDFEGNMIHVKRTISRILDEGTTLAKTEVIADTPKTNHSSRKIPLPKTLKRYLLEKYQQRSSDYVIPCKGSVAEPRVINYRFKKMIADTSFAAIHFHVLRHTFATRCLEQGVDIASLSKILGHRSTKMTLDIYTDSLYEKRVEAMNTVDNLLSI